MKTTVKLFITAIALLLTVNFNAEASKHRAISLKANESALQLEDWMTNESIWNTNTVADFNLETESNLELESWMTRDATWNINYSVQEEVEANLELEDWMTNDNIWDTELTVEPELTVESWMTDNNFWK